MNAHLNNKEEMLPHRSQVFVLSLYQLPVEIQGDVAIFHRFVVDNDVLGQIP